MSSTRYTNETTCNLDNQYLQYQPVAVCAGNTCCAGPNATGRTQYGSRYYLITTPLLQVLGTLILAAGTWAVQRLISWLNLKVSAQAANNLDQALQKAVTFG